MPAKRGNRRNRTVARVARVPARTANALRFVHHEQIDRRTHGLVGELGTLDERFHRHDNAAMDVEWIEGRSEVARNVGKPRTVEQREHLVILPPQLAKPLHGERFGHDDKAAIHSSCVYEPIEDQTRFDRLAESHFVGQQPAHGIRRGCALRHVELMRKQPNPSAKKGSEDVVFTNRPEAANVAKRRGVKGDGRFVPGQVGNADVRIHADERIAAGGDAKRRARLRKMNDERAAVDGGDVSNTELGIETVRQRVAGLPGMSGVGHIQMITDNERMNERAYAVARLVAPRIHAHFSTHQRPDRRPGAVAVDTLPDQGAIEAMIDTAFWASLRREEVYVPKISLAFLAPADTDHPLVLEHPLPLDPAVLTRVSPAVERPGIHLGVAYIDGQLRVWGTARAIPLHCLVVEVVEPGLIVVKHRRGREAAKFVNVAVLEGDQVKVIDEHASALPDCPTLLTTLLGFESTDAWDGSVNVLVQIAVSMRAHRRGGLLIVVPPGSGSWRHSIVQPIAYSVSPAFSELAHLFERGPEDEHARRWQDSLDRAVEAVAGLTAVDGATLMTSTYDVLAFGAKIVRRRGQPQIEQMTVTEPVEGNTPAVINPTTFGGTRHLSAAQFVHDQRDAVALVAGQDGRFTIFAWSPCIDMVHAHRVETLLL